MSRTARLLAQAAVALLALLVPITAAPAALAHDVLATSDPADGDVLATTPDKVTLVFSGEVRTLGTKIVVKGPDGEVQEGEPSVDRYVVTQALKPGSPAGSYTITWRVTSSDGHPISGTISFTSQGAGTAGGDGTASDSAPASTAETGSATAKDTTSAAGTPTAGGGTSTAPAAAPTGTSALPPSTAPEASSTQAPKNSRAPWYLAIAGGLVAAAAGAYLLLRKR